MGRDEVNNSNLQSGLAVEPSPDFPYCSFLAYEYHWFSVCHSGVVPFAACILHSSR